MRNYRGELAECTTANLLIVKDGAALTPPLEAGLLAGVARARFCLLEVADEEIGARHARAGAARCRMCSGPNEASCSPHNARGRADGSPGWTISRHCGRPGAITLALDAFGHARGQAGGLGSSPASVAFVSDRSLADNLRVARVRRSLGVPRLHQQAMPVPRISAWVSEPSGS